ncbi:hypothetical protein HHK36_027673 [Tetracentron sinense]|uniref:CCT domain-containing protein n=1 Tax=Tetracentron sinense TaxID=13715 RepID=A0A834YIC7_TETSI|nr:hypothetical protein HHK36_027673 [Tetracentron sinense]
MSSDLLLLDGYIFSSDVDLQFLSDPFVPFPEPPIDIIQSISNDSNLQFSIDQSPFGDQTVLNPLSSSPPSKQMNNLSICPTTLLQSLPISANSAGGITDSSVLDTFGVKSEDCYVGFDFSNGPSFLTNNNNSCGTEKAIGMMQRSFSSHSLDRKQSCLFQHRFNSLMESPNFETQFTGSSENSKFTGNMRRACSTGDLQRMKRTQSSHGLFSSPLVTESSLIEESSLKVGRYSAEERKERIKRYRSKRNQRNFKKTIKYACRKTLADSRPRVRGRFARNDETGEIPKVTGFNRNEEDEDELWDEESKQIMMRGGPFCNYSPTQFQYYGF